MQAPAISACLGVKDTQVTVDFYEKLGFTALPTGAHTDNDDDLRILLFGGEFALMIQRHDQLRKWLPPLQDTPVGAFGMFYLAVDDVDSFLERIRPLVDVVKETEVQGRTVIYFTDPDGYIIGVNQKQTW
jgi:catechol 2,3-dioxygenase-like lactoylglutathione lyase family enzyme